MNKKPVYKVVVWPEDSAGDEVDVSVKVRCFEDLPPCLACGRAASGFDSCKAAAYQDGHGFGEMLIRVGSSEYRRGLLDALREGGHLQSANV